MSVTDILLLWLCWEFGSTLAAYTFKRLGWKTSMPTSVVTIALAIIHADDREEQRSDEDETASSELEQRQREHERELAEFDKQLHGDEYFEASDAMISQFFANVSTAIQRKIDEAKDDARARHTQHTDQQQSAIDTAFAAASLPGRWKVRDDGTRVFEVGWPRDDEADVLLPERKRVIERASVDWTNRQ